MQDLVTWSKSPDRKPLVLRGARQVGKTWLLKEFGSKEFVNTAYVNCQRDKSAQSIFSGDLDPSTILRGLEIATQSRIIPGETLVIIDEIQEAPYALTSLKYFQEEIPELHVAAAGSLLGVATQSLKSFPVGKVNFLDLYPLDFEEFLRGINESALANSVREREWPIIKNFKIRLTELLKLYLFIGGMPEPVYSYSQGATLETVRSIQTDIVHGYENDFAKYTTSVESRRINEVWRSLPSQLAKENRRFILSKVREGARGREYEGAIQWLVNAGLVYKVNLMTKPGQPPRAFENTSIFKLFALDVGLLGAQSELNAEIILNGHQVFEEFKGALTEQYVLQQLISLTNGVPMYWSRSSENARAEIDFVISNQHGLVPIEVKSSENVRSKSLRSYINTYKPQLAIRCSLRDHIVQDDLTNIPLYAITALVQ